MITKYEFDDIAIIGAMLKEDYKSTMAHPWDWRYLFNGVVKIISKEIVNYKDYYYWYTNKNEFEPNIIYDSWVGRFVLIGEISIEDIRSLCVDDETITSFLTDATFEDERRQALFIFKMLWRIIWLHIAKTVNALTSRRNIPWAA